FSDIKKYLYKALLYLKDKKKKVNVSGLPLCFLKGFEKFYSFEQLQRKLVKDKKCLSCTMNDLCGGFIKEYADVFGTKEAKPYKKVSQEVVKILHWKKNTAPDYAFYNSKPNLNLFVINDKEKENAVFEKKKHIRLLTSCNNNCQFCIIGKTDGQVFDVNAIKHELLNGVKENCTKVVLSGGEPTIHPNFLDIVHLAKKVGYQKIQVITNGRMFSYINFLNKAVKNGLTEVTFSIHGHNAKIHDELTNVKGSFSQTIQGIKNAILYQKKGKLYVNADIVINKKNYKFLPSIIKFLYSLGIREIDLLQVIPFGYAWINKKNLLFRDSTKLFKYLRNAIRICKKLGINVWTNRVDPSLLEGNENLIHDPWKLKDELYKERAEFLENSLITNGKFYCHSRCNYCFLKDFCSIAMRINTRITNRSFKYLELSSKEKFNQRLILGNRLGCKHLIIKNLEIQSLEKCLEISKKHNYASYTVVYDSENLTKEKLNYLHELMTSYNEIVNFEVFFNMNNRNSFNEQKLRTLTKYRFHNYIIGFGEAPIKITTYKDYAIHPKKLRFLLKKVESILKNVRYVYKNVPFCFVPEQFRAKILWKDQTTILNPDYYLYKSKTKLNLRKLLMRYYIKNIKYKSLRCKSCLFTNKCKGAPEKYLRIFGFKQLNPIKNEYK
ncbi:MAG: radical SAM protein, partial [Candidatus Helarchaeota archaeon]